MGEADGLGIAAGGGKTEGAVDDGEGFVFRGAGGFGEGFEGGEKLSEGNGLFLGDGRGWRLFHVRVNYTDGNGSKKKYKQKDAGNIIWSTGGVTQSVDC